MKSVHKSAAPATGANRPKDQICVVQAQSHPANSSSVGGRGVKNPIAAAPASTLIPRQNPIKIADFVRL